MTLYFITVSTVISRFCLESIVCSLGRGRGVDMAQYCVLFRVVSWLFNDPVNMQVHVRDGPAQTILSAGTL